MMIEEAVLIKAARDRVWRTFTDLACWKDWNSTACETAATSGRIVEGERIRFCLRPFGLPVHLDPVIEEVVPYERVVWSGSKFGISSRHVFLFQSAGDSVLVTSREEFRGLPLLIGGRRFTEKAARDLVRSMLRELKTACESSAAPPGP